MIKHNANLAKFLPNLSSTIIKSKFGFFQGFTKFEFSQGFANLEFNQVLAKSEFS